MRYASIRDLDISNGTGVGVSLFVQGCPLHCKNCFNPNTWEFDGGEEWTDDTENTLIQLTNRPYIKRVSILGGEPLANPNRYQVFNLCRRIKSICPDKTIWLYSGYTYEQICQSREQFKVLTLVDVLVDVPYIDEQRDISLAFRGSRNQRLINVPETLKQGKIITIQND